jgi:glycosyltransferase involved in cell wall biosynthesis
MSDKTRVSIIVPTKNRPEELFMCLDGLMTQINGPSFEVLIVNDHSKLDLLSEYKKVVKFFTNLNLLFLHLDGHQSGAASARNLAFKHCSGEIIALLDDDAIPAPDWLTIIDQTFKNHPEIDAITGWITPLNKQHPLSIFRQIFYEERYEKLLTLESTTSIQKKFNIFFDCSSVRLADNLSGGNSALRRSIINQSELFDTKFTMMHDKDLTINLLKRHMRCCFIPELKIQHKHTKSLEDAIKKSFRSGEYRARLEIKHADIINPYSALSLSAPFRKLNIALKHKNSLHIKPVAFIFYAFLFEYLHQFRYLSCLVLSKLHFKRGLERS